MPSTPFSTDMSNACLIGHANLVHSEHRAYEAVNAVDAYPRLGV